jgi:hypothetical protein
MDTIVTPFQTLTRLMPWIKELKLQQVLDREIVNYIMLSNRWSSQGSLGGLEIRK